MKDNIYFLGWGTSEIAADFDGSADKFFAGSITVYGDNTDGNISHNVTSGMQLNDHNPDYGERNAAIYRAFFGGKCREIMIKDPNAKFYPYSNFFADMVPDELRARIVCGGDREIRTFLESKFNFKKLIKGKVPQADFEIMSGAKVRRLLKSGVIPNERPCVIQAEYGAGGRGTFIAAGKSTVDPDQIDPNKKYVISEFVPNTASVSAHFQITANGIAIYPMGVQIMDGASFVGCDIHKFSLYDQSVKDECTRVTTAFGELLRAKYPNLRGYFGLDMIITSEKTPRVLAVETNPRFTSSVGLLNTLCHRAGVGGVYEHTMSAFYDPAADLTSMLQKIKPNGRKRYAAHGEDVVGVNKEGLDKTTFKEEGCYTHAVFEEIKHPISI